MYQVIMLNWFHLLDKSSSVDRHEILIIKKDMETIRSRGLVSPPKS